MIPTKLKRYLLSIPQSSQAKWKLFSLSLLLVGTMAAEVLLLLSQQSIVFKTIIGFNAIAGLLFISAQLQTLYSEFTQVDDIEALQKEIGYGKYKVKDVSLSEFLIGSYV